MQSSVIIGLIGLIIFIVMLFTGLPVSVSMMLCGTVGCMFFLRTPMSAVTILSDNVLGTFTSYTTSVCAMFMLMGDLASESGIGRGLFETIQALTGSRKGILASASQVVCAIFGAICGSGSATASMMCRVAYPEMVRFNYKTSISTGCIASGASLATLIPPSLPLIAYGLATNTSIGKLFLAGILTGVMLMVCFIIVIQIWCVVDPSAAPASVKTTLKEKIQALKNGSLVQIVLLFALAMGGIFAGWFTPTEAGVVGVAGIVLLLLLTRKFTWKILFRAIENTIIMSGVLYCLLAGATTFGKFFTLSRIPVELGLLVENLHVPALLVIFIITIIYLVLGCFIDVLPLMLLTAPIFLPVIQTLGYDPLWFGVYVVVIMGLGAITPPVGMSCYITSSVSGVELQTVFKGALPFIIAFVACAMLMAIIPGVATYLPHALM
ncbi:MAG: TRAP transporter large permease [Oscillospiraceae bacterium]|nr:TRAP transporter large permease [Oscillospiraceae bacterium]